MRVAVLPARGGSKRIPKKNIRSFCGKPIISWVLETVFKAEIFDKVYVSTDDEDIARISVLAGAEVPFMRPNDLANDFCGIGDVVAHAANWCANSGFDIDYVCCVFPTAPLLEKEDLIEGLTLIEGGGWDYIFSVAELDSSCLRAFKLDECLGVNPLFSQYTNFRSQDLPKIYQDAGQFYWGKFDSWINHKEILGGRSRGLIIPNSRARDIDTEFDWNQVELMASKLQRFTNND